MLGLGGGGLGGSLLRKRRGEFCWGVFGPGFLGGGGLYGGGGGGELWYCVSNQCLVMVDL